VSGRARRALVSIQVVFSIQETGEVLMIGSLMMRVSVVILLVGLVGGVAMGVTHDFQLAAAHAHLNLIGGVLLFLFGLYHRLVPDAGASSLAKTQGWLHMTGAIVFPIGIALVTTQGEKLVVAPIIGSLIVVAAVLLFAIIVFRTCKP